jgi:hypothetical protein
MDWKWYWRNRSRPDSIYRGISLERQKGHRREESRSLGQDLNQRSPIQETGVLPTGTWLSIECFMLQVNVCPKLDIVQLINNFGFRYDFRALFFLKQSQHFDFTALGALVTITGRVRCNHNFLNFDLQLMNFVSKTVRPVKVKFFPVSANICSKIELTCE